VLHVARCCLQFGALGLSHLLAAGRLLLDPPQREPQASRQPPNPHRTAPISPQVRITPLTTKRVEHSGVKVQLIGQIELASERGTYHDFISLGALGGGGARGRGWHALLLLVACMIIDCVQQLLLGQG